MSRIHVFGLGLASVLGSFVAAAATAQEPAAMDRAVNLPPPLLEGAQTPSRPRADERVKPLMEGPLHEAFLSPRKDLNPVRIEKAPPAPAFRTAGGRPAQRECGMDRGLLGVGCRPERFCVGDRNLASRPTRPILG